MSNWSPSTVRFRLLLLKLCRKDSNLKDFVNGAAPFFRWVGFQRKGEVGEKSLHLPKIIFIVVPKNRCERKHRLLYIVDAAKIWENVRFFVLLKRIPICDWWLQSQVMFRFYTLTIWAAKGMTLASIRNTWKQGSWLLRPTVHNSAFWR